jgi:superfamily II DNA or RNA helicase
MAAKPAMTAAKAEEDEYLMPYQHGFSKFITRKFYELSLRKESQNVGLFPFQRFVREYINEETPYRGILLFYGLGAGKTRTAISACDSFLKAGKQIVVITPASLQQNFRSQYTDYPPKSVRGDPERALRERFTFLNYNGGLSFARSHSSQEEGSFDTIDLNNKVLIIDEVHNLISIIVNAMRSKKFRGVSIYNKIMNAKNLRIIALSGTPIINFPFEVAVLINILAGYLNDDKTPWIPESGLPRRTIFPSDEEVFNSTYLDMTNSKAFQILPEAQTSFKTRLVGYISYYAGLTGENIYPQLTVMPTVKVAMSNYQFRAYIQQRQFEISEMQRVMKPGQYSVTKGSALDLNLIEKKSSFRASTREVCNFAFPSTIPRPWRREIRQFIMGKESKGGKGAKAIVDDPSMTTMDLDLLGDKPEENRETTERLKKSIDDTYHMELETVLSELFIMRDVYLVPSTDEPTDISLTDVSEDTSKNSKSKKKQLFASAASAIVPSKAKVTECLDIYSPKMLEILKNITSITGKEGLDGSIVVYSYFNKVEGINIFQNVLEAVGYEPYDLTEHGRSLREDDTLGRYCFWSGDNREEILQVFNSPENNRGDIIKVLLITEAGAEGITLKNVRQLHIMEPYWNEVLIRQVIGRANRMYSHEALPLEERNVTVYRYETTFTPEQALYISTSLGWDVDEKFTTDEIISMIAARKQFATDQIEEFMKSTAVDCKLNLEENNKHRSADNLLLCFDIQDSSAVAKKASTFSLTASAKQIAETTRFSESSAKQVKVRYNDLKIINDGVQLETDFVYTQHSGLKPSGEKVEFIKIYLADPVKRGIGMEEYLVGTLFKVEKGGKVLFISKKGQIKNTMGEDAPIVKYVFDEDNTVLTQLA